MLRKDYQVPCLRITQSVRHSMKGRVALVSKTNFVVSAGASSSSFLRGDLLPIQDGYNQSFSFKSELSSPQLKGIDQKSFQLGLMLAHLSE